MARGLLHDRSMGHDRPASTDIQDTAGYKGPHHKVSHDERGPDAVDAPPPVHAGKDVHARILGISIHGGKTRIAIGSGPNQGVFVGAPGYLIDQSGHIHKFEITDAENSFAYAFVDAIPDALQGNVTAIVNPSNMPANQVAKKDHKARILQVSVDGKGTRIAIAFGPEHGALIGMKGFVVNESGYHIAPFEVEELRDGFCIAHVQVPHEQVYGADALLNPS